MRRVRTYLVVPVVFWAALCPIRAAAQSGSDLAGLNRQVAELYKAGNYAQAAVVGKRAVAAAERQFGPNHVQVATPVNDLAVIYNAQGRHAEAEPLLKRALAIYEKNLGSQHASAATAINNLADMYTTQGRYADAEQLSKRALAIREKALGPNHIDVAVSLNNLAEIYRAQNRYGEAEPLYKRAVVIGQKTVGADHPTVGLLLNNQGALYDNQARYGEAEPLYRRSLAIREKALGPSHPDVGVSLNNLSGLFFAQGRYADAEPLNKRALAIFQKALGPDHPQVATVLGNLGEIYRNQGRYDEAEPLYKRSIASAEKAFGPNHPMVATTLSNLALLCVAQGRDVEAEPLLKRSLEIRERTVGSNHRDVGISLFNLAGTYHTQGRYAEAEPYYARAVKVFESALAPDHPDMGTALNNLAWLKDNQGRQAEAEPLYRRALAVRERALGADHPDVAATLNNLAGLLVAQGRTADAEPLLKRSLPILEKGLGPDHPFVGQSLQSLGDMHFVQWQWAKAADYWRQSTNLVVRRIKRGTQASAPSLKAKGKSEAERESYRFIGLIKALHRVAEADAGLMQDLARETFKTAQWAQASEAAAALAQMAARQAKGEGALARLIRERQDLTGEWQTLDSLLVAAVAQPSSQRNALGEQQQRARLTAIDVHVAEIDKMLAKGFPEYATLASADPLSVGDVQALLHDNEALIQFLDTRERKPTPGETFVWVVTKTDQRWLRGNLGTGALAERVAALRCGLDHSAWEDDRASRCAQLLNRVYSAEDDGAGKPLPFDLARAHALYQELFGQFHDVIKGKQLLIVPSGPLTSIPLQVLVAEAPTVAIPENSGDYASAAWLARRHALTVLPSVASLASLRRFAKASKATQPFIGFGNPLLLGPSGSDRRAWLRQVCSEASTNTPRVASRSVRAPTSRFFRAGLADVEVIRGQYPLPETADELCTVAQSAGSGDGAVYLGANATEKVVKALSANGSLGNARVVHFATHGLLASETGSVAASKAEPALILTPPSQPSEIDDGLLTASEVTQLKLDADWVVLSACNTAAGDRDDLNSEALSGLARAFFYAGARALLVSHWAVESKATVSLVTKAFDTLKSNSNAGRAEALRRSMLDLIDTGGRNAHPSAWAPFVVVGEGAR